MTKIREFSTRWGRPDHRTFFERDLEALIGSAQDSPLNTPNFRPFDMLSEPNQARVIWQNDDMRIGVESLAGTAPTFRRGCDYDELLFQFAGETLVECEYGVIEMKPSELLLIPSGIAHRSTGKEGSLRVFVQLPEPVSIVLGEDKMVSHTEFDMVRRNGPSWANGNGAELPKGRVLEKLSRWDDGTTDTVTVERNYEHLVSVASQGRGIQKLRAFDFFTGMTGKSGPGPMIMESSVFNVEVYNTEGSQFAFHRGLDNDEMWLQFRGDSVNESEFGGVHLMPGEMNHVPAGIAHHVVGGEGFLRLVLYSRKPWELMVDPTQHAFESSFEPKEKVLAAAEWKTQG
jgi:quercetin dioxygenase-like cupin family protein